MTTSYQRQRAFDERMRAVRTALDPNSLRGLWNLNYNPKRIAFYRFWRSGGFGALTHPERDRQA